MTAGQMTAGLNPVSPETKAVSDDALVAFDDFMRLFESFKQDNDDRLKQIEKRMGADVITTEKVDRISHALDEHKRALDQLALKKVRPALGRDGGILERPEGLRIGEIALLPEQVGDDPAGIVVMRE